MLHRKVSETAVRLARKPTGTPLVKKPPSKLKSQTESSVARQSMIGDRLGNSRNSAVGKTAFKSVASNESTPSIKSKSLVIPVRKRSVSVGGRKKSMSQVKPWTKSVEVKMNNAAIKRQNHIRQRLRAEWVQYNGQESDCPFD